MTQAQATMASPGQSSLRERVLRAGGWTIVGHGAGQIIRLASNLIMTRLLVPEMFGVMALASVMLVGLQLLSDLGLRQSIVQSKRGQDTEYLNTAWTVQIIRGCLIWLAAMAGGYMLQLLGSARLLAAGSVYADPVLPYVIGVLSFNALVSGFESTKLATANRNLMLGRITLLEMTSQLLGLALMVSWAFMDRSIWALVAGSLATCLSRTALSHFALPGQTNKLHWDPTALREIVSFGKWIFVTSILGFLAVNGDRLMLGWLVDAKILGIYVIAFFMVGALRDVFAKLIGNVTFPALSEVVRQRPEKLKETYYRMRRPIDIVSLLSAGALFSAGHLIVELLYDDRYLAAGWMLQILSIALFEVRFSVAGQCFMALGKPKLLVPIIAIQVLALYLGLPLAFNLYGIEGAIWMAGGSVLFTLPMTLYLKIKLNLFDIKRELLALPWLAAGLLVGHGTVLAVASIR